MIRLVVSGPLPRPPVMRSHCLANPDSLLTIAGCPEAADVENAALSDRFSLILHDLRMGGAWKRTNRGRLRQTEEVLSGYINADPRDGITLLDIGASDGITTVEALRALRRTFGARVTAIVADRNLSLLRYRRGPVVEYRAADGEPVMARIGRLGVRLARPRQGAPSEANRLARLYLRCVGFRAQMRREAEIPLVHPVARREPGVVVIELDCLVSKECLKDRIAAIRASNVLNLGYFAPPQLRLAVGHLHGYLRDGGCLVVSRNHDEPIGERENGSVWLKHGARFRWVRDFGAGSEIRQIIDDWPVG